MERQIAAAEANGGDPPVELQKRRAELAERIAHHQDVAPKSRDQLIRTHVRFFRPIGWDDAGMDRDRLKRYLEQGLSLPQIGALENRDPSTVGYWVRKHGLEANGRGKYAPRGALDT